MQAEIITVGDELLIGQVIDTNSAWLGQTLNKWGIRIHRINSISDDAGEIKAQLSECLSRSELIIMTGGLGPTKDDITKKNLAEFFNAGWREDAEVLEKLRAYMTLRGRNDLFEINKHQATLPDNCTTLFNNWGTAPGMWFETDGKVVISMPGVPYEMKNIFETYALPKIITRFKQPKLYHKTIVTINLPESLLAKRIEAIEDALPPYIRLAYLPNWNMVRLRLTGTERPGTDIESEVNDYARQIMALIAEHVVIDEDLTMAEVVFKLLNERHKTLSMAESCTGGFVSHQITAIPGSSKVFIGSVVSYAYEAKTIELGIPAELLNNKGAVSKEVVEMMAEGIRKKLDTDYAVAISGIAGPTGGTPDKPVGTVWICIVSRNHLVTESFLFPGDRISVIGRTANMALAMLRNMILEAQ